MITPSPNHFQHNKKTKFITYNLAYSTRSVSVLSIPPFHVKKLFDFRIS